MSHLGWSLIHSYWSPSKMENLTHTEILGACTQRENTTWGHSWKEVICKPNREASGEIKPPYILILNIWLPELYKNTFIFFKPCSLWHFVMAALLIQSWRGKFRWNTAKFTTTNPLPSFYWFILCRKFIPTEFLQNSTLSFLFLQENLKAEN